MEYVKKKRCLLLKPKLGTGLLETLSCATRGLFLYTDFFTNIERCISKSRVKRDPTVDGHDESVSVTLSRRVP